PATRVVGGAGGMYRAGPWWAAPHLGGAPARVRRLHRDGTPAEIKALLMNTAGPTFQDGVGGSLPYPISLQGAGRVRADVAAQTLSIAMSDGGSPSLSLGFLPLVGAQHLTRGIRVRNKSDAAREFRRAAA